MNNIQTTAIRLIANAYLFSKEKDKSIAGYRFDGSFLTKRGITSVGDLDELQKELNRRGWCFNVLALNDFLIQEKSFLAKMTKLGFGRVKDKTEVDIKQDYLEGIHDKTVEQFFNNLSKVGGKIGFTCEITTDTNSKDGLNLDDGITIKTPDKKFLLTCSTRENNVNAIMKISFDNPDINVSSEIELPARENTIESTCNLFVQEIKKVFDAKIEAFNPKSARIGNQVWMTENLAYDDGGSGIIFNKDNGEYYYTWDAAKRIARKLKGWHLPTKTEFEKLSGINLNDPPFNGKTVGFFDPVYIGTGFNFLGKECSLWTKTYKHIYPGYFEEPIDPDVTNVIKVYSVSFYEKDGSPCIECFSLPRAYRSVRLIKDYE